MRHVDPAWGLDLRNLSASRPAFGSFTTCHWGHYRLPSDDEFDHANGALIRSTRRRLALLDGSFIETSSPLITVEELSRDSLLSLTEGESAYPSLQCLSQSTFRSWTFGRTCRTKRGSSLHPPGLGVRRTSCDQPEKFAGGPGVAWPRGPIQRTTVTLRGLFGCLQACQGGPSESRRRTASSAHIVGCTLTEVARFNWS